MNIESAPQERILSNVDLCIDLIRYAQATELTRTGRYLEAEALLAPKGRIPESARDLDLLARIATLQKQFDRAERFWESALQKAPGNLDYTKLLERVRELEPDSDLDPNEESNPFETILCYVGGVISILGIATIIWAFWPRK